MEQAQAGIAAAPAAHTAATAAPAAAAGAGMMAYNAGQPGMAGMPMGMGMGPSDGIQYSIANSCKVLDLLHSMSRIPCVPEAWI